MGLKMKCFSGRKNGKEHSRKDVPRHKGEKDHSDLKTTNSPI